MVSPTPRGYDTYLTGEAGPDGRTAWTAWHPALPGCSAKGDTIADAVAALKIACEEYLARARERGETVAAPISCPIMTIASM